MKISTAILALFAVFATASEARGSLFADRREALEKTYGNAMPVGGYGPSPSPKPSPSPAPKPTPGSVVVDSKKVDKTSAYFVVRVSNADSIGGKCYSVSPNKPVGFAMAPMGGSPLFKSSLSLNGLKPATMYACELQASNGGKKGPVSKITFTTLTSGGTPGEKTPGAVSVTGRKTAKTSAQIDLATPNAKTVTASCKSLHPSKAVKSSVSARGGNPLNAVLQVSGLQPGTAYTCTVQGVNGKAKGPSSRVDFTTASNGPATPPPGKPVLKSVSTTRNSAKIVATKPKNTGGLRSNCRANGSPTIVPSSISATSSGVVVALKNLKAKTSYNCSIYAVNSAGTGPALSVSFTTKK